jgi:hypothetical protein
MIFEQRIRRILGVSILGASEGIHVATMALHCGVMADDVFDLIHACPTRAEAARLVAISFTKDVHRLMCCASSITNLAPAPLPGVPVRFLVPPAGTFQQVSQAS